MPLAPDETLPAVIARMREVTVSSLPLASMGKVSAMAFLRASGKPTTPPSRNVGAPADVMYTDMGYLNSLDSLPWSAGQHERAYTGLLDVAGPESITIFNTRIGSARNISITFHDNVFGRNIMDRVSVYLKDPTQFLDEV